MQAPIPTTHRAAGFTLSELLVVIVIIVLLLGLAVPAFHLMKGSRSVDSAENQISALISRARADAIGLQTPHGIIFYLDSASGTSAADWPLVVAEVMAAGDAPANPASDVYLDRKSDTDHLYLPAGVLAMTLNSGTVAGGVRSSDGYLGYNSIGGSGKPIGGLILFGGNGELISRTWGYYTWVADAAAPGGKRLTSIGEELGFTTAAQQFVNATPTPVTPAGVPRSSLGLVLFDRATFLNQGGIDDPQMTTSGAYNANEQTEEQWIDDNSTPLLINRVNGTLVRGE